MSETVKARQPLLRPSHVPSLTEIRKRMADRFGGCAPMMRELVQPCAEEAEHMLYEILNGTADRKVYHVFIKKVKYAGTKGHLRKNGYCCSACGFSKLSLGDRYCSGCGMGIKWE